jgi:hypothetical protein
MAKELKGGLSDEEKLSAKNLKLKKFEDEATFEKYPKFPTGAWGKNFKESSRARIGN